VQEESVEERRRREHKAESIRRMLTDSTTNLTADGAEEGAEGSNGGAASNGWVKHGM